MLKKILATAIAAAMIFGMAATAFAAGFSDTAGHAKENQINTLAALGVLNGYGDGTFKPGNTITRAEFAKVVVAIMAMTDTADVMATVPTGFSDVPVTHWANGFIAVAVAQEIINGYPDGTFKPEAPVTYAEAVTMVMRALGYGAILEVGVWPIAYLTKASQLGVLKGITFTANGFATRANIAAMLFNAMTKGKVVQVGFGADATWELSDDTFLDDLGASSETGWLVGSPESLYTDDDMIELACGCTYELAEGVAFAGLLGHNVKVWYNEDDEALFIEDLTSADEVVEATYVDGDEVEIDDDDVEVDDGIGLIRNFGEWEDWDEAALDEDDELVVIFDGDDPMFVLATAYQWGIVNSLSSIRDKVYFKDSDAASLDLEDYDVQWSGAADEFDDLEEDQVVNYIVNEDGEKAICVVTEHTVTGKFTKWADPVLTVGGSEYECLDDFFLVEVEDEVDDLVDLIGSKVTALLDKDGNIVKIGLAEDEEAETTDAYGVVLDTGEVNDGFDWVYKVKLFGADGAKKILEVDEDLVGIFEGLNPGDVILYTIDNETEVVTGISVKVASGDFEELEIDDELSTIEGDAGIAKLTSTTVVFMWEVDGDEFEDASLGEVSDLLDNEGIVGGVIVGSAKAKVVVFLEGSGDAEASASFVTGMITGWYLTSADTVTYRVLVNGVVSDYEDPLDIGGLVKGDIVKFKYNSLGEWTECTELTKIAPVTPGNVLRVYSIDAVNGIVAIQEYDVNDEEIDGRRNYYLIDDDTLYYDVTDGRVSIEIEDLEINSPVDLYAGGAGLSVIVVVDEPEID